MTNLRHCRHLTSLTMRMMEKLFTWKIQEYRVSKKTLIAFIFKLAASRQEFDRSYLNISWIYEAYQISEPLIVLKHKPYSLWE